MNPIYRSNTYATTIDTSISRITVTETGTTGLSCHDLLFFPGGGGQPPDNGWLVVREEAFKIQSLIKSRGDVVISLTERLKCHDELKKGEPVRQIIDWPHRYRAARFHSAQHTLGAAVRIAIPDYETRGMTISSDLSRCAMCFYTRISLSDNEINDLQVMARDAIAADLPIQTATFDSITTIRESFGKVFRMDPNLPEFKGNRVRTILIGGPTDFLQDVSACGGTHLSSLAEVGQIQIADFAVDRLKSECTLTFDLTDKPSSQL